jgi:hypothetical protein
MRGPTSRVRIRSRIPSTRSRGGSTSLADHNPVESRGSRSGSASASQGRPPSPSPRAGEAVARHLPERLTLMPMTTDLAAAQLWMVDHCAAGVEGVVRQAARPGLPVGRADRAHGGAPERQRRPLWAAWPRWRDTNAEGQLILKMGRPHNHDLEPDCTLFTAPPRRDWSTP